MMIKQLCVFVELVCRDAVESRNFQGDFLVRHYPVGSILGSNIHSGNKKDSHLQMPKAVYARVRLP